MKELSVQLFLDTSYQLNRLLTIQLFSDTNKDIFAYLCGNLIETIEKCETEAKAIRRNVDNDFKQEIESFNSEVKRNAKSIYNKNNKK